jgi:hypothetical protein
VSYSQCLVTWGRFFDTACGTFPQKKNVSGRLHLKSLWNELSHVGRLNEIMSQDRLAFPDSVPNFRSTAVHSWNCEPSCRWISWSHCEVLLPINFGISVRKIIQTWRRTVDEEQECATLSYLSYRHRFSTVHSQYSLCLADVTPVCHIDHLLLCYTVHLWSNEMLAQCFRQWINILT